MKILTWNINGLRATKQSLKEILECTNADVICLQETKITRDQLQSDVALIDGYNSYFSFSETRSGYSGVATYCKDDCIPIRAQCGLTNQYESECGKNAVYCYGNLSTLYSKDRLQELDREGRTVITQHQIRKGNSEVQKLTIFNVYCPRADPEKEERKSFKIDFYKLLEERAKALIQSGSFVCIVGDVNTSHKEIDHCDPQDPVYFHDNPGRLWLDSFLYNNGDYTNIEIPSTLPEPFNNGGVFVDSFRYFYPKRRNIFSCWCTTTRARETNYGTRLDYILCDISLLQKFQSCEVLTEILGSDHCPVEACIDVEIISSKVCPALCTRYMAEYGGRQQKIFEFVQTVSNSREANVQTKKRLQQEGNLENSSKLLKTSKGKAAVQGTLSHFIINCKPENNKPADYIPPVHKTLSNKKSNASKNDISSFWKGLLKGPDPSPLCSGHKEPSVLRTVKKEGPNIGRQFYCCARPDGHHSNPEARCRYFEWVKNKK